jgi:CheY-like chemotaxis protein
MPLRVLVIDDEPGISRALSDAASDAGYDVRTAENGLTGLARAAASAPDVILLDLVMPMMNGWDFAREYHRQPPPHAPIILMTAFTRSDDEARRAQSEVFAVDILRKPFDVDEMLSLIQHYAPTSGNAA